MTAMTTTSSGTLNPEFFSDLLAPRRGVQLIPASRAQGDPSRSPGEKHDQCHREPTVRRGSRSMNKQIAIRCLGAIEAGRSIGRTKARRGLRPGKRVFPTTWCVDPSPNCRFRRSGETAALLARLHAAPVPALLEGMSRAINRGFVVMATDQH